ncbi:MAG: Rpn family recombination-promoting nuclease/putative transposase [Mangrovibacterium sp.]
MIAHGEKYVNLFTDFGFKKLFGEELSKERLKDFLNELLRSEQGEIVDLSYLNPEQLGGSSDERRAIFDIYCENEKGERFIVELQKVEQKYFKDRSVYYSTFPITEQAKRSKDWNFELQSVYTIGILDFEFKEEPTPPGKYQSVVKLLDVVTKEVFFNKLTYIYLEMPKFTKTLDELETHFDKWLYVIRNLHRLDSIPDNLREQVFTRLFEVAEIAKFDPEQREVYENSLKSYRDIKNSVDTAEERGLKKGLKKGRAEGRKEGLKKGMEKGRKEGRAEGEAIGMEKAARNLLSIGASVEMIQVATGLSAEEIKQLSIDN